MIKWHQTRVRTQFRLLNCFGKSNSEAPGKEHVLGRFDLRDEKWAAMSRIFIDSSIANAHQHRLGQKSRNGGRYRTLARRSHGQGSRGCR